jgi:hypothetical protein
MARASKINTHRAGLVAGDGVGFVIDVSPFGIAPNVTALAFFTAQIFLETSQILLSRFDRSF